MSDEKARLRGRAWLGTALSMMLVLLLKSTLPNGDELYAFTSGR